MTTAQPFGSSAKLWQATHRNGDAVEVQCSTIGHEIKIATK